MLRPYFDFDRDSLDTQVAAEIRLNEHTHRPATPFFWQLAARRPDPALPSEGNSAPPRAHRTLGDGTVGGDTNRAQDVRLRDRPRPDVVQKAVIRFADHRIGGAHVFVPRQREQPGEPGAGGAR